MVVAVIVAVAVVVAAEMVVYSTDPAQTRELRQPCLSQTLQTLYWQAVVQSSLRCFQTIHHLLK